MRRQRTSASCKICKKMNTYTKCCDHKSYMGCTNDVIDFFPNANIGNNSQSIQNAVINNERKYLSCPCSKTQFLLSSKTAHEQSQKHSKYFSNIYNQKILEKNEIFN